VADGKGNTLIGDTTNFQSQFDSSKIHFFDDALSHDRTCFSERCEHARFGSDNRRFQLLPKPWKVAGVLHEGCKDVEFREVGVRGRASFKRCRESCLDAAGTLTKIWRSFPAFDAVFCFSVVSILDGRARRSESRLCSPNSSVTQAGQKNGTTTKMDRVEIAAQGSTSTSKMTRGEKEKNGRIAF